MTANLTRSLAAGVLLIGVFAALPFYQRPSPPQPPPEPETHGKASPQPLQDLTLQVVTPQPTVPLVETLSIDAVPAIRRSVPLTSIEHRNSAVVPAPELPTEYQSLLSESDSDFDSNPRQEPLDRTPIGSESATARQAGITRGEQPGGGVPEIVPGMRHAVVDGDTLETIAGRYLGSPERAGELFEANRDVLASPDVLPIGVELKLSPAEAQNPAASSDRQADIEQPQPPDVNDGET